MIGSDVLFLKLGHSMTIKEEWDCCIMSSRKQVLKRISEWENGRGYILGDSIARSRVGAKLTT
jgi:hypothetical protein